MHAIAPWRFIWRRGAITTTQFAVGSCEQLFNSREPGCGRRRLNITMA
jgi:hypothetical protein